MPAPNEPDRRFTFALSAAVAATTVAAGVTAATLLGWFRPAAPAKVAEAPPAAPALVYVPIAPAAAPEPVVAPDPPSEQLAMDQPREHEREHEHGREHEREGGGEDDDD